jgi:hypothetical protein
MLWPAGCRSGLKLIGLMDTGEPILLVSGALSLRPTDLDTPGRHLGVFALADEVKLRGADVAVAGVMAS